MEELTIDKEFDELCPPLSKEEEQLLEESIVSDGCMSPIITWANHDDTILDGHNRYRLCRKHDRPFKTKSLKIDTREQAVAWILRTQLGRRNLGESQRAMLAAKMATLGQGESKPANLPVSTQAEAAEQFGVSERTVRSAAKVLEQGSKPLKKAVEAGSVPVSVAAVVAELPKAEQAAAVAKGPEAVKAKAKEIKEEKAAKKYADSFDPDELTSEATDAFGNSVPAELDQAFQLREGFKEQRNKLTSIKTWLTQNANHPGAMLAQAAKNRIVTDIDNADRELKFSTPHCVCIYCHNKSPKVANCTACKGSGWVNESIYKAAPKGMQRVSA